MKEKSKKIEIRKGMVLQNNEAYRALRIKPLFDQNF